MGIVSNITDRGEEYPPLLDVTFHANGGAWFIKEPLAYRTTGFKIGKRQFFGKKVPLMKNIMVGQRVKVIYKEDDPKRACIAENRMGEIAP